MSRYIPIDHCLMCPFFGLKNIDDDALKSWYGCEKEQPMKKILSSTDFAEIALAQFKRHEGLHIKIPDWCRLPSLPDLSQRRKHR
jgi:hypothetical protein